MIDIERVGIVGAGTMGRRIAFGCIIEGVSAHLYDVEDAVVDEARAAVETLLDEWVEAGRLTSDRRAPAASRLSTHSSLSECVEGVDLVVEAVPENVDLKRTVFAEIDEAAAPDTLLVTNSSSIPGSELADATDRPEQVANVNFGPPEDRKVEVMSHSDTESATMEAVVAFVRNLGLVPIRVQREIMGYAVNRIWRAVKKETLFLLDGGYATPEDIDRGWMLEWDAPMGPCGLMDKVGLDVVRDIEQTYYEESGDPSDRPPQLLHDMIEAGKLGEKTGEGFYSYPDPAYEQDGWLEGEGDA
jgi:3-hydroxybutyryl-CoA dehydrogenase